IKDEQWPDEARKIMDNAGLEPGFRHLADHIYGHDNLAEGKVYASSSDSDVGHSANLGADNNWKSSWQGKEGTAGPCWWSVDLGEAHVIQKVGILPLQDKLEISARKNLEIQASNDPGFKTHVVLAKRNDLPWYHKMKSSNLWEEFINVPQGYRYLRVTSTDPKAVLSMGEFFAYGYRQHPAR
ncbi:MAG TPA: discoidin domain-containing protein, partial [Luteolibacter sp.]